MTAASRARVLPLSFKRSLVLHSAARAPWGNRGRRRWHFLKCNLHSSPSHRDLSGSSVRAAAESLLPARRPVASSMLRESRAMCVRTPIRDHPSRVRTRVRHCALTSRSPKIYHPIY